MCSFVEQVPLPQNPGVGNHLVWSVALSLIHYLLMTEGPVQEAMLLWGPNYNSYVQLRGSHLQPSSCLLILIFFLDIPWASEGVQVSYFMLSPQLYSTIKRQRKKPGKHMRKLGGGSSKRGWGEGEGRGRGRRGRGKDERQRETEREICSKLK